MAEESGEIVVRSLASMEEIEACVRLEQNVWGFSDYDLVPSAMFAVAQKIGGQALGAFDGSRIVGFALAFPGIRGEQTYLHSHMAAVLPEYQGRGVGRRLKLAQRKDALERGIGLIEWTFDPLQIRNARFNISQLGAIVRHYVPNAYGRTSSKLHHALPTDRFVAEWWLAEPRVEKILSGTNWTPMGEVRRVALPLNIDELCRSHPEEAKRIQEGLRDQCQRWFSESYAITAIEIADPCSTYLLERL